MLLDYVIIKLSESKKTKGVFTLLCNLRGGGEGSLKCLSMIMGEGEGEGGWPCVMI